MAVGNATFNGIASILGFVSGERTPEVKLGEIDVAESFLIDRPASVLYAQWRDFAQLPRILTNLERVEVLDDRRSRWTVHAPPLAGGTMQWEVQITEDIPNERLAWRSTGGGEIEHEGFVRFEESPRGTRMRADLRLRAPSGRSSFEIAKLLGQAPALRLRTDLTNWKRVMEVGEAPTIQGQPRGTCGGRARKQLP